MNYHIALSKQANKVLSSDTLNLEDLLSLLGKFISYIEGKDVNIDAKKLSGSWRGYYRLRSGNLRVVFKVNFDERYFYVKRIAHRGNVYK